MIGEEIKNINDIKPGDYIYITTDSYINKCVKIRRIYKLSGQTFVGIGPSKNTAFSWDKYLTGSSWVKLIKRCKK